MGVKLEPERGRAKGWGGAHLADTTECRPPQVRNPKLAQPEPNEERATAEYVEMLCLGPLLSAYSAVYNLQLFCARFQKDEAKQIRIPNDPRFETQGQGVGVLVI